MKSTFRSLVTGQFDKDLDYMNYELSFQTVFFKSTYAHCCCPCAFQHEYLEYVSNLGEIDEELYERIQQNILCGKCPHVDGVSEKYIRNTSIYAIHIAAGVGTEQALRKLIDGYQIRRGAIFRLCPYSVAVLKSQYNIINIFTAAIPVIFTDPLSCIGPKVMYPKRSMKNSKITTVEWITTLEHSIRAKDIRLLNSVLSPNVIHCDLNKAFEFIFQNDFMNMEDLLYEYTSEINHNHLASRVWIDCAASFIIYDKPKHLDRLLEIYFSEATELSHLDRWIIDSFTVNLLSLSAVLKRLECSRVLQKYQFSDPVQFSVETYLVCFSIRKDIDQGDVLTAIKCLPDAYKADTILRAMSTTKILDVRNVKRLLECTGHVNVERIFMGLWTNQIFTHHNFREVLELVLYENPHMNTCLLPLSWALDLDLFLETKFITTDFTGHYIMDSQEHTMFDHEGEAHYALNFFAPCVLECGVRPTRMDLIDALSMALNPVELSYIRKYLYTPRSLQLSCRDVLRCHFKRRQIHAFVDSIDVPIFIKEFILLKSTFPAIRK